MLARDPVHIETLTRNEECYVLLPGSSGGLHHPLMKMLYEGLVKRGQSVAMIEYPFQTRSSERSSNELAEELEAVKCILDMLRKKGMRRFNYICKSLGGIVATRLMREDDLYHECESIHIMGCVIDRGDEKGIDIEAAAEKIDVVVQGELDEFGSPNEIVEYMVAAGVRAHVKKVADGDHSYRHHGSRELPTHEAEAVSILFEAMGIED